MMAIAKSPRAKHEDELVNWDLFEELSHVQVAIDINSENILITRERHRQNLEQCVLHLENFKNKNHLEEFDKAAEDLRLATRHLGIIVGKVDVEEILDSIFNDFCIGK